MDAAVLSFLAAATMAQTEGGSAPADAVAGAAEASGGERCVCVLCVCVCVTVCVCVVCVCVCVCVCVSGSWRSGSLLGGRRGGVRCRPRAASAMHDRARAFPCVAAGWKRAPPRGEAAFRTAAGIISRCVLGWPVLPGGGLGA